jgi:hypothetical protein
MTLMKTRLLRFSVLASLLWHPTRAEEGGSGHYLPGSMSSFMDAPPPKGAFIARYNMIYYQGDLSAHEPLPIAGLNTVGAAATSWAHGVTLGWGPPVDLGERLTYSITATIPLVSLDVSARVTAGGVSGQRTSSVTGLGDIVLMPLMLNYAVSSNWSANVRLAGYAPTGDYELGRLANTGKNFWTVEPTVGLMYFGKNNGIEASVYFGSDFNLENPDTDYRTGTQVHGEGTLAQHFPLFGGLSGVGINAYWYEQISGDSGSGASFGDFKGRTAGLGPVLSHVFKIGSVDLLAEVKWLHEFETRNRLDGDTVWVKVIVKF